MIFNFVLVDFIIDCSDFPANSHWFFLNLNILSNDNFLCLTKNENDFLNIL